MNQYKYSMKQTKEQVFCYYSEKISYHIGIKIKKKMREMTKICFVNESRTLV